MAININELSLTVKGNVVKNNTEEGDTILRASQEQAWEIFEDLRVHFERNPGARAAVQTSVLTSEAGIQHDGDSA